LLFDRIKEFQEHQDNVLKFHFLRYQFVSSI
jgi:hypothetical protein